LTVTTREAVVPETSQGTCRLIWVGDTANSGAGMLLMETLVLPKEVGRGNSDAVIAPADVESWVPNTETTEPGAIAPADMLAAFTTPFVLIVGVCAERNVWPAMAPRTNANLTG